MHLHQTQFTCKNRPSQNRRRFVVLVASLMVCVPAMRVRAQADGNTARDEVDALTPFTVVSDRDTGYAAENLAHSLAADPNTYLPNGLTTVPTYGPAGGTNPYAGWSYVETNWFRRNRAEEWNTVRLTLSHELDLGKWGNYRAAGMAEFERHHYERRESWEAWDVGSGLIPAGQYAENVNNKVFTRPAKKKRGRNPSGPARHRANRAASARCRHARTRDRPTARSPRPPPAKKARASSRM